MIRAMMGKKKIEYVLYRNQGTPDVFVDGTKVGTVKDGVCKWLAKRYDKDVTVTLTGVSVQSTSVVAGWDHGNEVDGVYVGWKGQYPKFYGYRGTHTYRFISGNFRDTYRNTAVTKGILTKGATTITINQSSTKLSREWYNTDTVTYKDNGEQSTSGTWDGSINISGDTVTVNYGTDGMWSVLIYINGKYDLKAMDFIARW